MNKQKNQLNLFIRESKTGFTINQFNQEQIERLKKIGLVNNRNRVIISEFEKWIRYLIQSREI